MFATKNLLHCKEATSLFFFFSNLKTVSFEASAGARQSRSTKLLMFSVLELIGYSLLYTKRLSGFESIKSSVFLILAGAIETITCISD